MHLISSLTNHSKKPLFNFQLKELILLFVTARGVSICLGVGNYLSSPKNKHFCEILQNLTLILMSLSIGLLSVNFIPFTARFLVCFSIFFFFLCRDSHSKRLPCNLFIHISNASFLILSFNYFLMIQYPDWFTPLWKNYLLSAAPTFDLIILCMVFQTLGYYVLWDLMSPVLGGFKRWFISSKNFFNLIFTNSSLSETRLIIVLIFLGSLSRTINFMSGIYLYTDGTAITGNFGFIAQFDRLYYVGLYYAFALTVSVLVQAVSQRALV